MNHESESNFATKIFIVHALLNNVVSLLRWKFISEVINEDPVLKNLRVSGDDPQDNINVMIE